jgi:glycosyltransferase involved in cell wall biosynthesis
MNILQINSGSGWSGGQYQVLLLSRGLMERGHHVVIVCPPGSALAEKASKAGLVVEPIRMRGEWDLKAVYDLCRVLRRHRIEVINTHKPKTQTLARMAASLARVPVVVATRRVSFPLRQHLLTRLKWVTGVARIIAVSKKVEEVLIRSGVPSEKAVTIYGAIDLKRFHPGLDDRGIRREFELDEMTPVVGKVADYRPWKGYQVFLEAAALILSEMPEVRFFAIGKKMPHYDEMLNMARRLGIERQVVFTGFRDDVERFYRMMAVSVNCATEGEGLPGVLRESLAMEVPVVATDVGGSREVVMDGETGLIVPPSDPKAMAQAILRLLKDPELRLKMGRYGHKRMEEQFSIDAMVNQTEALYRSLLR